MTENQANQTEASEAESMDLDSSKVSSTASHSLANQEDTLPTWWKTHFLGDSFVLPALLILALLWSKWTDARGAVRCRISCKYEVAIW